jgi:hypothetical protein
MDFQLKKLKNDVEAALAGMSNEQLSLHAENKWSVAEVLEHLYLTYTGTIRGFEKVLSGGKPLATHSSLRQRMRIIVVVGLGYMPEGRKSPANAQPKGLDPSKVRAEFAEKIEAMDKIIGRCEARFGARTAVLDHPILGPLTAAQWRKFHLVHGRHHYKQILQRGRDDSRA